MNLISTDHLRIISMLIILVSLAGCGTYTNFYSNYDRSTDFFKYKTFAWLPDKNSSSDTLYDNDIVRNNTKNYFIHCFTQREYTVNTDTPDILLQLVLLNEEKEEINTVPDYSSPSYYYNNNYYYPYYYPNSEYYTYYNYSGGYDYYNNIPYKDEVTKYVTSTITLNIIDRKLNRLIWTGTAEGDIYDISYVQYDVHPGVHKLLKQYPVEPLKGKDE